MGIKKLLVGVLENAFGRIIDRGLTWGLPLVLPYWTYVSQHWSWPVAISLAIILLAATLAIHARVRNWVEANSLNIETVAELRYTAPNDDASAGTLKNIARWYSLDMHNRLTCKDGTSVDAANTVVFILFDRPVAYKQFRIDVPNAQPPLYEIKDKSDRHAVIVFTRQLAQMTVRFYAELHDN